MSSCERNCARPGSLSFTASRQRRASCLTSESGTYCSTHRHAVHKCITAACCAKPQRSLRERSACIGHTCLVDRLEPQITLRSISSSVTSSSNRAYSCVVRVELCALIRAAFSMTPPQRRKFVMPVARKVWQQTSSDRPARPPCRNDARYPGRVTVFYPLHPLHLQELEVFRPRRLDGGQHVEVQLQQRRLAIPLWMTRQEQVERLTLGRDPRCSPEALLQLTRLLQQAGL